MNEGIRPLQIIDKSDIFCSVSSGVYFGVTPRTTTPPLYEFVTPNNPISLEATGQTHRLDLERHLGDELDNVRSSMGWVDNLQDGLELYFPETDFSHAEMLGLGAGQAHAELELVRRLGIPIEKVTLLDRHFSNWSRKRIAKAAPAATVIEEGMFTFLSNPNGRKYSLITTFGLHDAIDEKNKREFLRLVPNVMTEGGVLLLTSTALPGKLTIDMAKEFGLIAPGRSGQDHLFRYHPQDSVE